MTASVSDTVLPVAADFEQFPDWFVNARAAANGRYGSVTHDGCRVAYQAWGKPGAQPLLMLHGAGASSEWWEPAAVLLADRFHIVAPSTSGVGRSEWRDRYVIEQWVAEAMACARAEGVMAPDIRPICVAHSFGSESGARLAIDRARPISQLILVDTLMGLYGAPDNSFPMRNRQHYATPEDAIRRFSTVPRDDYSPAFLRPHVARQSLERIDANEADEAWSWRADPNVMGKLSYEPILRRIGEAQCPMDFIYGGRSSMSTPEIRAGQALRARKDSSFHEIAEAGHHIPLDRPQELALMISRMIEARQE